jgi:hypothetical protein
VGGTELVCLCDILGRQILFGDRLPPLRGFDLELPEVIVKFALRNPPPAADINHLNPALRVPGPAASGDLEWRCSLSHPEPFHDLPVLGVPSRLRGWIAGEGYSPPPPELIRLRDILGRQILFGDRLPPRRPVNPELP